MSQEGTNQTAQPARPYTGQVLRVDLAYRTVAARAGSGLGSGAPAPPSGLIG